MQAPGLEVKDRRLRWQAKTAVSTFTDTTSTRRTQESPPLTALSSPTCAVEREGISILDESDPPKALIGDPSTSSSKTLPKFSVTRQVTRTPSTITTRIRGLVSLLWWRRLIDHQSTGNPRYEPFGSSSPTTSSREGSVGVDLLPKIKSPLEDGEQDAEENERSNKSIPLSAK
ncbi:BQ2448_6076 [Microbotryum intermedium]|uniref:BQ2448_6076 protein n=1 Tax=Microbotryum intermedium TaxID=269621 RepID=A0A238FRB9_9BASI|nr:BQ2448_6076 [Microbotryum intermedium]